MKVNKKIILLAIILVVALVMTSCLIVFSVKKKAAILKTQNFSVTSDMMSYLIETNAEKYIDYQKSLLGENYKNTVDLSLKKSLKLQKSPYNKSWFDYFYDISLNEAKELLAISEEALEKKTNFSDNLYSSSKKEAKSKAKKYKIGESDLEKILILQKKAEEYKKQFSDDLSEVVINKYYENNRKSFDCIDYKIITIKGDFKNSNDYTGDEYNKIINAAKEKAENLLEDIKANGFDTAFKNYALKNQLSDDVLETVVSERYSTTQFSDWAFNLERKAGDAIMFPGKNQYSIYCLTKTMYPYDYKLANGLIYEKLNSNKNQLVLSGLITKWKDYSNSKKGFIKFTDDCGLKEYGQSPLFKENIHTTISSWMYSSERKYGDFEVCRIGDFIYAMWFENFDGSYFSENLKSRCFEDEYKNHLADLINKNKFKERNYLKALM